jgi:hypothetical protein
MKRPKFTDAHKFTHPYAPASESAKPGYLARKFDAINKAIKAAEEAKRAEAEKAAVEQERKVRKIKEAK